ncbi:MAG: hypothetical protein A2Y12_09530 [Planctomycetes bacterium GWF2_42_9]|nr:MAG: hypothetical protein A2Y12_09530 [Planctomycetes bacterium GWF2_42_9]
MKKLVLLLLCFSIMAGIFGCQKKLVDEKTRSENLRSEKKTKVIVDGNGIFPKELAGLWIGDAQGWRIRFTQTGDINSVVLPLGKVTISPGETKNIELYNGGKGIFKAGEWTTEYSYKLNELAVEIVINYFKVQLGKSILEGSVKEYLIGKTELGGWVTSWASDPNYIVCTSEYKNYRLPIDFNQPPTKVIFTKIPNSE